MRVLIIGGTGFVGTHTARALVAAGHRVSVLHRGHTQAELPATLEDIRGNRRSLPAGIDARPTRIVDTSVSAAPVATIEVIAHGHKAAHTSKYDHKEVGSPSGAVKGYQFGLDLSQDERSPLIAFLRTR